MFKLHVYVLSGYSRCSPSATCWFSRISCSKNGDLANNSIPKFHKHLIYTYKHTHTHKYVLYIKFTHLIYNIYTRKPQTNTLFLFSLFSCCFLFLFFIYIFFFICVYVNLKTCSHIPRASQILPLHYTTEINKLIN